MRGPIVEHGFPPETDMMTGDPYARERLEMELCGGVSLVSAVGNRRWCLPRGKQHELYIHVYTHRSVASIEYSLAM